VTKQPGDADVRGRLQDDLDSTFVVEAAAGTGKTTVLVERIVQLVKKGRARLEQLISVTFTEKAAGEMKLRLRTKLEKARDAATDSEERRLLTVALEEKWKLQSIQEEVIVFREVEVVLIDLKSRFMVHSLH
jgi:ATP-dependent exoDNAse (exonuclease V) beta subunit